MSDTIKPELIEKTQKVLAKHITKPSLTEKLLKKPPFRFLHDIVTNIVKETGFLKGLYTENELISDNVKERDAKITFLTKLIDAVKTITEIDLKAKPTKIIAGLEPTETNKLLQALGLALDKKLDSTEYIKSTAKQAKVTDKNKKSKSKDDKRESVRSKKSDEVAKSEKGKKKDDSARNTKNNENIKVEKKSKKILHKKDSPAAKDSPKIEEKKSIDKKVVEATTNNENQVQTQSIISENVNIEAIAEKNITKKEESTVKAEEIAEDDKKQIPVVEDYPTTLKRLRTARPKSARPQSSDIKKILPSNIAELVEKDKMEEKAMQKSNITARPMSSLRPPSVRPPSARPGAPRLRPDSALPMQEMIPLGKINVIVENYNAKDLDEEETVVIHNIELEPEPIQQILNIPEDKGHLVEQILEQIHDDDVAEHAKTKNEIDWESEGRIHFERPNGFRNRDATTREVNQLKSQIQSLTKVANPLGKLMNYLHEDIESMMTELNMWINMKREMNAEINKQKKINDESSKPLKIQLEELEEGIKKQETEIVNLRSNIIRNDVRIKILLAK